jgi:hypothetical protein
LEILLKGEDMLKRLTIEYVREQFEKEGYELLSTEYVNTYTKLDYICPKGHKHYISWKNFSKHHGCPYCFGNVKYDIDFIRVQFEQEGYILLTKNYENNRQKLEYICPEGHAHTISFISWKQGGRCAYCAKKAKPPIEEIRESFRKENYILLTEEYKNCFLKLKYECPSGHTHSISWSHWKNGIRCAKCNNAVKSDRIRGSNSKNWKGGVKKLNLPLYNTYAHQLYPIEKVRPYYDENNRELLEIECSKCNRWFVPTRSTVNSRINALNGNGHGESRLYCSQECKDSCEVYGKNTLSYINLKQECDVYTQYELSTWSQEVLNRADYICEICGAEAEHAHHIQPKKLEPGLALDPDNGLALCKNCHNKYGHRNECSTGRLATTICDKGE